MSHNKVLTGVALIVLIVGVAAGYALGASNQPPAKTTTIRIYPKFKEVAASQKSQLEYVNQIRAQHGLAPLTESAGLDASSKLKAQDMIARHYFAHDAPDGTPFYALIYQHSPGLRRAGENLGECNVSLDSTFDKYVHSPEHLANIINPNYTLFGSYLTWNPADHCEIDVNQFGAYQ